MEVGGVHGGFFREENIIILEARSFFMLFVLQKVIIRRDAS